MSDLASHGYSNSENIKFVLGDTTIREPLHPYQLQWVAHCNQANCTSSSQSLKHFSVSKVSNIEECIKAPGFLPFECMKPGYSFECKNMWTFDSGKQDMASYFVQSAEVPRGEQARLKIISNSVVRKNVNSSAPQLPASSNWGNFTAYHFQDSERFSSEWKQFPMFDINRKMGTVLAPKRSANCRNMAVRTSKRRLHLSEPTFSPHSMEFAAEQDQHQQHGMVQITDQEMSYYESIKGSASRRPNMTTCMRIEEDKLFSSGLEGKDHFANTNNTYLKDELHNSFNHPTFMVSGRLKNGSTSGQERIPQPFLVGEHSSERESVSASRLIPNSKRILGKSSANKMLDFSNSDVGTMRSQSSSDSMDNRKGLQEFPDATQNLLTKRKGTNLFNEVQMVGGSMISANVNGTAFFERLTLPTAHGQREENSHCPVTSADNIRNNIISAHFMEKQNESSLKTDTPRSSAVGTSYKSQKDVVCSDLKSYETPDANSKHASNRELSTSRTESMDVDHILSHVEKPSSSQIETTLESEPSRNWLKRLQSNQIDSNPLGTKRLKTGDEASRGEVQNLFSRVLNYNRSISELAQCQPLEETTLMPKYGECSSVESTKVISWLKRWSRGSQDMVRPSQVLCEPESFKVVPEKFEAKQFPSLAGMALMGKAAINFRPCEFLQKGSSIVWNT